MVEEGDKAIDFTLKDQNGDEFILSDFEGQKVLLSFHPLAGTSVCAKQMKALDDHMDKFKELEAISVGISVDSSPTKKLWDEKLGLDELRMLSDFWPHGGIAKKYDLFREDDGFSERANIIIDEDQKIIFRKVYPIGEVPDLDEIFEILEK
ncbi:MAG: peroxiredoxin [Thermoplasmata archaeon]